MKTRFPNVTVEPDRHGKLRARFRKSGYAGVRFKFLPDQPGFADEYRAALGEGPAKVKSKAAFGTVEALIIRYYRAADFAAKGGEADKERRRGILERFCAEHGRQQVEDFTFEHIEAILLRKTIKVRNEKTGRMTGGEVAAHELRKQLARLFAYAVKIGWCPKNPVAEAEKVGKRKIKGFHTWTEDEIAQYQKRHPLGTKARLALEIILWTGQRRGNAFEFGPRHIVKGKVNFHAIKGGASLWLPVARDLRAAIDAMPSVGLKAYIVTDYGNPFTEEGFGNKIREWCDEAGLPHCTAHGLRKAIARRMAQSGATDEQMMAVGGWRQAAQLRTYTEAVDQAELAEGAMDTIDGRYSTEAGE